MDNKTFSWQDYSVFGGMLVSSTLIGIYYAWKDRRAKNSETFLTLKDAQLGLLPVSVSLVASYISAITILAIPGEMYTHGSQWWFCCIGILFSVTITDFVFLPVLYHMDVTSINEYYYLRFGSSALRSLCSIVSILGTMFYLGAVLFGPSLAISSVTDLNLLVSIITIGAVCTFYTTIGGLKAVIWTDVVQMVIMITGLLVVIIKVSHGLGGLTSVFRIANAGGRIDFFKFEWNVFKPVPTFWTSILQPAITWSSIFVVSQTSLQRISGMPTFSKARILTWLNVPGVFFLTSLACMCGIAIYAHYSLCDPLTTKAILRPDQLMPYYVMNAFEHLPGVPGIFVACVFSGSLSTLSSGLNATAAITWSDFFDKRIKVDGKKQILITKLIVIFYGILLIGLAFLSSNLGSILQASAMLSDPFNAGLLAIMTLGVLCPFANKQGMLSALLITLVLTCWTGIGGALVTREQNNLPTNTEACLFFNATSVISNTVANGDLEIPSGIKAMQYLSPYLVGIAAYFLCLTLGIIGSLLTGGARAQQIPRQLVHPVIIRIAERLQRKRRYPFIFPQFIDKGSPSVITELTELEIQESQKASVQEDVNRTSL